MDEIRRRNVQAFLRSFFSPALIAVAIVAIICIVAAPPVVALSLTLGVVLLHSLLSYYRSIPLRFRIRRFLIHWNSCQDRLSRLRKAIDQLSKSKIARLEELPKNIEQTSQNLYLALRRADLAEWEITKSEGWYLSQAKIPPKDSNDPQARELMRIADKNLLEYKHHLDAVLAGIERAEAQSTVFVTALDTLRVKMLGYRLAGRKVEDDSMEFLTALTEAKMQLDAIDQALEELELTPMPQTIAVMPDSPMIQEQEEEQTT